MYTWEEGLLSQNDFITEVSNLVHYTDIIVRDNKDIEWYNIPAGFDIETSSFYVKGEKRACMYIWQFGIYSYITSGRTWEEFINLINIIRTILRLNEDRRLVIYVHNLPYEFQWIRKWIKWDKVFLLDDRKPVYCNSGGLEYRCSLKLAGGRSLDSVSKELQKYKVKKLVGNLDYNLIRTPLTPLTKKELMYCENDIRVILCYIMEKIEQDGDITKIPLTNTGYVRQHCRKECFKRWKKYMEFISSLTIDTDEYLQLKRAFQGGFTHANSRAVDKVLYNVGSHDLRSSYPSVMVMEKFPMSKSVLIKDGINTKELEEIMLSKCCMFDIEIWGLYPKILHEHILSLSKCYIAEDYMTDNGRLAFCGHLKTTITEQDYFSLKEFYEWDLCYISNLRVYDKGYLPKNFVLAILDLYNKKTKLKGVAGEELEYMIAKNMINAAYGMIVTDPVREEIYYEEDNYSKKKPDIEKAISKYNSSKRRFLFYPWGVWVTSYARANLMSSIISIGEDYVYSDTDSIKCIHPEMHEEYFATYNKMIIDKIQKSSSHLGIPIEKYMPVTIRGEEQIIGTWADEGIYDRFKTLGAKRYLTEKDSKIELTVAGVNKKKATEYLITTGKPFENFTSELIVPEEYSGRLLSTYIDFETEGDIVDYTGVPYHFHELSSVHMEPTEYSFDRSEEFANYLKGIVDDSE